MKGIYVLIVQVGTDMVLGIGALGEVKFRKSLYAYVGSTQKNLQKRIERHMRDDKKCFWHIDYLLQEENTKVIEAFFKEGKKAEECVIAKEIDEKGERIEGFGSSDCKCKSHLFRIRGYGFLPELMSSWMNRA